MAMPTTTLEIKINASRTASYNEILTEQALAFITDLHQNFNNRRLELLSKRTERIGQTPDFVEETEYIRDQSWTVNPVPHDLQDRRVEITGPVDRKMVINALNSGAKVFMADFEDSNAPTWRNCLEGQINLKDAVNKTISFFNERKEKHYRLNDQTATLMVRPRGWHMNEEHVLFDHEACSASLFDFGLFFFHNARTLIENGSGPYFYLPKLENYLEARLWNDVFVFAQQYFDIPQGTIKATVLIETIWASFQMEEILFELKEHSAGLNCGRWDYIFSFIKTFINNKDYIFPDKSQVGMSAHCMKSYTDLLIQTCHKRGAHAMGGMAAQIPIKDNPNANNTAIQKVKNDKLREVLAGHDGTWVAHPGLVNIAIDIFNTHMPTANQLGKIPSHIITQDDLLELPSGTVTEKGLRSNINVSILYLDSWLRGNGAAAIHHMMEDAATAEISRTQVRQWLLHKVTLDNKQMITEEYCQKIIGEEVEKIKNAVPKDILMFTKIDAAVDIFNSLIFNTKFQQFLTLPASKYLS